MDLIVPPLFVLTGGGLTELSGSLLRWGAAASAVGGPGSAAALVLSVGLVGSAILDRFLDRDGEADGGSDDPLGGDPLGGEVALDDGGSLDGLDGMDDWDDSMFGDEESEGSVAELERRIEELEDELGSLSSTVGTVRSENAEISETVDDVGENVRKLLDIYEMVTRGINPFVDEPAAGGVDAPGGGALGLFDDEGTDGDDGLDEEIADADAEGFFDEELLEPDEEGVDADEDGTVSIADDAFGDPAIADDGVETEVDDGGGKSFDELKAEYDAGEADWTDDGSATDPDAIGSPALGEETADEEGFLADGAAGREIDGREIDGREIEGSETDEDEFEFVDPRALDARSKPYLGSLPDGFVADFLVLEWVDYLVERSDATDAVRAVRYYEAIGWIDDSVAARLRALLEGLGDVDRNEIDREGTERLTLTHHARSLRYVTQLADATVESAVLDRWTEPPEGDDGI
ncbi:FlaD/FlaE family flagellar protein [Halegenticoccus tardaugens]|uniref:FlaD/FlaE family flagellar protein n=1 Tax=Halegenticoccus tardaugens TaxID=2071624 RepID=UPI00100A34CF|nr:FlaD/FlaE family flagellar protein [Halegenticoccus tardaugens]